MNLPIEFWIYLAAFLGTCLGFFTASVLLGAQRRRIEKATWSAAELYYKRRYQVREPQI